MAMRRYSDREIAFILKRAVDLDEEKRRVEPGHGITLQDLREIARDVGIDPAMVEQAATELDQVRSRSARALAADTAVVREIRSVPRPLEDAELRMLLWAIDRSVPDQGTLTEALGELRWTAPGQLGSTQVAVKRLDEETVISVERSLANVKGPLLGIPAAFGAIVGAGLGAEGGSVGTLVMSGLLLGIAGFFVGGGIWQLVLDHQVQRVRSLMEKLVGITMVGGASTPGALSGDG
jgi:hypothetical protein